MGIIAFHLILIFLFHFLAQSTNAKVDFKRDLEEYSWAIFRNPRFPGDIFFRCEATSRLRAVLFLNDQHRPQRWGFVIIRTAYGAKSDEQFDHALRLIDRTVRDYYDEATENMRLELERDMEYYPEYFNSSSQIDLRPIQELQRRHKNDILEDPMLLDKADIPTIRNYFVNWISGKNGRWVAGDIRFAAAILLDEETLAQLETVPENPSDSYRDRHKSPYWVKMIEAKPAPVEPFRIRIFGRDDLVEYWFRRNWDRWNLMELLNDSDANDPSIRYYGFPQKSKCTLSCFS